MARRPDIWDSRLVRVFLYCVAVMLPVVGAMIGVLLTLRLDPSREELASCLILCAAIAFFLQMILSGILLLWI